MSSSAQGPTISGLRVRTTADAKKLFEAVLLGMLPIVKRRLDSERKRQISSGQVYVWEDRSSNHTGSASEGIERWTDSIQWGQSHVKDEFLFYDEKERADVSINASTRVIPGRASRGLIKQTYSVYVQIAPNDFRKWHMTAYSKASTLNELCTVDNHPRYGFLRTLEYPPDRFTRARGGARRTPPSPLTFRQSPGPRVPVYSPARAVQALSRGLASHKQMQMPFKKEPSLAPLEFLQGISPHSRHPMDEEFIMSFPIHETLACC